MTPLEKLPSKALPDRGGIRTCLSILLFGLAAFLPLLALAIGWIGWDWKHGAVAAGITFLVFFLAGATPLITLRTPGWAVAFLPLFSGLGYTILPDFIPGGFDDAAALTLGALLTFIIGRKKRPGFSGRSIIPLLIAGLFPLIGGFIPGPIDEFLVTAISSYAAWRMSNHAKQKF
jgi:hypothetical protein